MKLSKREARLLDRFGELTPEQQDELLRFAHAVKDDPSLLRRLEAEPPARWLEIVRELYPRH